MRRKAYIFIDGSNFESTQFKIQQRIDIIKFIQYFKEREGFDVYQTIYFMAYKKEQEETKRKFIDFLVRSGVKVEEKLKKQLNNGLYKGDTDVDLAVEALVTKDNYDVAILCTGDGDFKSLVKALKDFGKEVICVSTEGVIALDLLNACDRYIDLKDILPLVKMEQKLS
ncbi:MAG: NYN domain-containing protein [Aquificaceae bacterium]